MSNINTIATHIHKEVAKIKRKPRLSRNDFIRPHRTHPIHWDRENMADLFRSLWEVCAIEISLVQDRKPFCELLTKSGRFNKII